MSFAPNIHLPTTSSNDTSALPSLSHLPISHLESLRFKATQIIESIQALQYTLDAGGNPHYMLSWPDILSKYNVLLSQTHNFSSALVNPLPNPGIYERISLHPSGPMPDAVLDSVVIHLLRNQQTTEVLRVENETVGRLAGHMHTRGSVGVLGGDEKDKKPDMAVGVDGFPNYRKKKPEYEDVIRECDEIAEAHDKRVERATRAVLMLRDKFDWKQRVEVEVEEPEELEWDPRFHGGEEEMGSPKQDTDEDEDESNVQGALLDSQAMEGQSPSDPLFSPEGSGGLFGSDIMSPASAVGRGEGGPMSPDAMEM